MIVNVVLDDDDTRLVEEIKRKKGNKNTAQIVRESIRCHHAFLFEQNYQYIDNCYKPSSRPTMTPEERAEIDENWDR